MLEGAELKVSKHKDGIIFPSKFIDPLNSIRGLRLRTPIVRLRTVGTQEMSTGLN